MELVSASTLSLHDLVRRAASQLTGAETAAEYLDTLVQRADSQLARAETNAECLEAKNSAALIYDTSKRTARILKAKGAHDEVIAAVRRSQADALEIEAMASRRLADEYDAAQERGELRKHGERATVSKRETLGFRDAGLDGKDIHEARAIRDAEVAEPGIVRRILDEAIEQGEEPTRTLLRETVRMGASQLIQQSKSNEHYTPSRYVEAAREVMGGIDLDPASCAKANEVVNAAVFYDASANGLTKNWKGRVWLNPPYGDMVGNFIAKLSAEITTGFVDEAVVLVNAHCTDTKWFKPLWDGALCFTDHRINFYGDANRSGSTHGSVFAYFGPNVKKFADVFGAFGAVVVRYDDKK